MQVPEYDQKAKLFPQPQYFEVLQLFKDKKLHTLKIC